MRILKYPIACALILALSSCAPSPDRSSAKYNEASRAGSVSRPRLPGKQPDGSILLHNQWSLQPAGRQVEVADFPVNVAVHPGGRYAAVLHCGYSAHEILIVDIPDGKVVSRARIHRGVLWPGLFQRRQQTLLQWRRGRTDS